MRATHDTRASATVSELPDRLPILGVAVLMLTGGLVAAATPVSAGAPPDIRPVNNFWATPGQELVLWAFDVNSNLVLNWEVEIVDFGDPDGDGENELPDDVSGELISTSNNHAAWEFEVPPESHGASLKVQWTATNGAGDTTTNHTWIGIREDPADVDPLLPQEVLTGLHVRNPIVDLDLTFHVDANFTSGDASEIDEVKIHKNWDIGAPAQRTATETFDDRYETDGTLSYGSLGIHTVGYNVTEVDTGALTVLQNITITENTAPEVDAGQNLTYESPGEVELRGHATDPESRVLYQEDYNWFLVGGPALPSFRDSLQVGNGTHDHHDQSVVGVHTYQLNVTDPYGVNGTDTLNITVDDAISTSAVMLDAVTQTSSGTYVYDTLRSGDIPAQVTVLDDRGLPVQGATVSGSVYYYGDIISPIGFQTETFNVTTDVNGVASIDLTQDVLGAAGEDTSVISATGYHEVDIDIEADSRPSAPIQDTETSSEELAFWVGPAVLAP